MPAKAKRKKVSFLEEILTLELTGNRKAFSYLILSFCFFVSLISILDQYSKVYDATSYVSAHRNDIAYIAAADDLAARSINKEESAVLGVSVAGEDGLVGVETEINANDKEVSTLTYGEEFEISNVISVAPGSYTDLTLIEEFSDNIQISGDEYKIQYDPYILISGDIESLDGDGSSISAKIPEVQNIGTTEQQIVITRTYYVGRDHEMNEFDRYHHAAGIRYGEGDVVVEADSFIPHREAVVDYTVNVDKAGEIQLGDTFDIEIEVFHTGESTSDADHVAISLYIPGTSLGDIRFDTEQCGLSIDHKTNTVHIFDFTLEQGRCVFAVQASVDELLIDSLDYSIDTLNSMDKRVEINIPKMKPEIKGFTLVEHGKSIAPGETVSVEVEVALPAGDIPELKLLLDPYSMTSTRHPIYLASPIRVVADDRNVTYKNIGLKEFKRDDRFEISLLELSSRVPGESIVLKFDLGVKDLASVADYGKLPVDLQMYLDGGLHLGDATLELDVARSEVTTNVTYDGESLLVELRNMTDRVVEDVVAEVSLGSSNDFTHTVPQIDPYGIHILKYDISRIDRSGSRISVQSQWSESGTVYRNEIKQGLLDLDLLSAHPTMELPQGELSVGSDFVGEIIIPVADLGRGDVVVVERDSSIYLNELHVSVRGADGESIPAIDLIRVERSVMRDQLAFDVDDFAGLPTMGEIVIEAHYSVTNLVDGEILREGLDAHINVYRVGHNDRELFVAGQVSIAAPEVSVDAMLLQDRETLSVMVGNESLASIGDIVVAIKNIDFGNIDSSCQYSEVGGKLMILSMEGKTKCTFEIGVSQELLTEGGRVNLSVESIGQINGLYFDARQVGVSAVVDIPNYRSNLIAAIDDGRESVQDGDSGSFVINVDNNGNKKSDRVVLKLNASAEYGLNDEGWLCDEVSCYLEIASVQPGSSLEYMLPYRVELGSRSESVAVNIELIDKSSGLTLLDSTLAGCLSCSDINVVEYVVGEDFSFDIESSHEEYPFGAEVVYTADFSDLDTRRVESLIVSFDVPNGSILDITKNPNIECFGEGPFYEVGAKCKFDLGRGGDEMRVVLGTFEKIGSEMYGDGNFRALFVAQLSMNGEVQTSSAESILEYDGSSEEIELAPNYEYVNGKSILDLGISNDSRLPVALSSLKVRGPDGDLFAGVALEDFLESGEGVSVRFTADKYVGEYIVEFVLGGERVVTSYEVDIAEVVGLTTTAYELVESSSDAGMQVRRIELVQNESRDEHSDLSYVLELDPATVISVGSSDEKNLSRVDSTENSYGLNISRLMPGESMQIEVVYTAQEEVIPDSSLVLIDGRTLSGGVATRSDEKVGSNEEAVLGVSYGMFLGESVDVDVQFGSGSLVKVQNALSHSGGEGLFGLENSTVQIFAGLLILKLSLVMLLWRLESGFHHRAFLKLQ